MVESGFLGAGPVGRPPPTRTSDDQHLVATRLLAKATADLVTIDVRHTDVEQHGVRSILFCQMQSMFGIVRDAHVVSCILQHAFKTLSHIEVVIDDQHTSQRRARSCTRYRMQKSIWRIRKYRHADLDHWKIDAEP